MGKTLYSKEKKLQIAKTYISGKDSNECAIIYGCSQKTVFNILTELNLKSRGCNEIIKKYTVNKNYFSVIDTADKAYWLGWMYSDGCNNRGGLTIQLQEEDAYILEKFIKNIEYSGKLKKILKSELTRKDSFRLDIYSEKISKDLSNLGCIPSKSLILKFPTLKQVPKHFLHHFIRGIFDGDGSIFTTNQGYSSFNIIGTIDIVTNINKIIAEECMITPSNIIHNKKHKKETVNIFYSKNKYLLKIYTWLYKDCGDLFLSRKKEKFFKIIQNSFSL